MPGIVLLSLPDNRNLPHVREDIRNLMTSEKGSSPEKQANAFARTMIQFCSEGPRVSYITGENIQLPAECRNSIHLFFTTMSKNVYSIPSFFHIASTLAFTFASIASIGGHGRVNPSAGHFLVASIPILLP